MTGLLANVSRTSHLYTTHLAINKVLVNTVTSPGVFYEAAHRDAVETGWIGFTSGYLRTVAANLSEWMAFRRLHGRARAVRHVREAFKLPELTFCTAGSGTGTSTLLASVAADFNASKDAGVIVYRFNAREHIDMSSLVLDRMMEQAERQKKWPVLVIDAADRCEALFEHNWELMTRMHWLTHVDRRMSILLASSNFQQFDKPMDANSHYVKRCDIFNRVLHLGELAPREMLELMDSWGAGKNLANLLISVYGGHPEAIFHALRKLQLSGMNFRAIEGFPGETTAIAAECVRSARSGKYPGMSDMLTDLAVVGAFKFSDLDYKRYAAPSNLLTSLDVGRTGHPNHVAVHLPAKKDFGNVSDLYWTIPSTQYMRVALACALHI